VLAKELGKFGIVVAYIEPFQMHFKDVLNGKSRY
jgi:hypothetical protein